MARTRPPTPPTPSRASPSTRGRSTGWPTEQFKQRITDWLQERGLGKRQINYKLRDWLFSRQRYWGEPFPILHELDEAGQPTGLMRPVPESELPLNLPELADFKPTGSPEGPLAKVSHWVHVCIDGKRYRRETNTMPQWAGSCWYYLRYLDPHNQQCFCDPAKAKYWLPVDVYIGGAEHAVLHLLYARFWHKVLYDRGYLPTPEPFQKLVNQGMILGENGEKMSKSRGNVVNPDEVIAAYGADSLRLFEMFMGPLEASKPWSTQGVEGVYRFLSRVWRLVVDDAAEQNRLAPTVQPIEPDRATLRQLHRTIQRVTEDLDHLRFNTAIAAMMEYTNYLTPLSVKPRAAIEPFVLLLAPFAPHLAEELWQVLGHQRSLAYEPWPSYDPAYLVEDTVEVPVQVNGKLRTTLTVPVDITDADLQTRALADERVRSAMAGKDVKKIILTKPPRRLVNVVV
jgi:leucyl-tRNA synthetase